ncbi:hypothetical protein [Pseudomonas sp. PMCC200344]|uniref:hypothetical protein n=1 Tax=Pseudomonas sp. PMCC200344 TaxID=3042028 RepID=UPI0024B33205|nr:hypothetical protein [Pseudomonas sp. PMCC200344]
MPIISITADLDSAGAVRCEHCRDLNATHIELSRDREHDPDEHVVVCGPCAYLAGLKYCNCGNNKVRVLVDAGICRVEFIPVYAPDHLPGGGGDDCNCDYLRLRLQPAIIEVVAQPALRAG